MWTYIIVQYIYLLSSFFLLMSISTVMFFSYLSHIRCIWLRGTLCMLHLHIENNCWNTRFVSATTHQSHFPPPTFWFEGSSMIQSKIYQIYKIRGSTWKIYCEVCNCCRPWNFLAFLISLFLYYCESYWTIYEFHCQIILCYSIFAVYI